MTEEKAKSLHFTSGLIVGTAVAAGAAFLYKTNQGKKVKKILEGYYVEAKDHFEDLIKDVKKQVKTKTIPEAVDSVAKKEIKGVKRKISAIGRSAFGGKAIKKNVFSKSGKPLVK